MTGRRVRRSSAAWLVAILIGLSLAQVPAAPIGAATGGDGGSQSLLLKTRVPLTPEVADAIGSNGVRVTQVWPEIDAMAVVANSARVAELQADPRVALVEPDQEGHAPARDPFDAFGAVAPLVEIPSLASTGALTTWNQDMSDTSGSGFDGTGVTVAIVDSGLPQNWPEFLPAGVRVDTGHAAGFGAEGWGDFHSEVNAIHGVGGHVGLLPHGLAVASVIAGFPTEAGEVAGAAPGATILPIRVLNQFNSGWFSWFTAGIIHVGRLKASGALPGPVVINFSIQAVGSSAVLQSAIDYAVAQGVVFVTIAGNFGPGPGSIAFPGRLPESITAGAVGWSGEFCLPPACSAPWFFADVPENDASQVYVAPFSGRESVPPPAPTGIDVLAPGAFVLGEWLGAGGFSEARGQSGFSAVEYFIFGTSFAAPHVVGIVAQMLEKNPGLAQAEVESILRGSALPIPPDPDGVATPVWAVPGWDGSATGSGLARGTAAVAATPAP